MADIKKKKKINLELFMSFLAISLCLPYQTITITKLNQENTRMPASENSNIFLMLQLNSDFII